MIAIVRLVILTAGRLVDLKFVFDWVLILIDREHGFSFAQSGAGLLGRRNFGTGGPTIIEPNGKPRHNERSLTVWSKWP